MPRKPKVEKKTVTVVVNGSPVAVTLHPPAGARKSWFAYWNGLVTSKSTGQKDFTEAVKVAENMLRSGGKRAEAGDAVLSDEEFEQIQRAHFGRKQDPVAQARAQKTLAACLEAIDAFKAISGLSPITRATPDDCAAFQRKALTLPKNWRHQYPRSKQQVASLTANTVLKWSGSLKAAFERANRNAPRRKCVRGVVDEAKLLTSNPWTSFSWIEGTRRPIRQFNGEELLSFLDYLQGNWASVSVVPLVAKVLLWSSCRRAEVAGLSWSSLRVVGSEVHFEVIGKASVEKWFRIPDGLYQELLSVRTESPFVFAAYSAQLRQFYATGPRPSLAKLVGAEFSPVCLADWFHERVVAWSSTLPGGHATTHIFRKTSLQHARIGEDVNRQVARDARVSEGVMMASYVKETDEQMRQKSNRSFSRILASLAPEVARRYGHVEDGKAALAAQLQAAVAAKNWLLVGELSAKLAGEAQPRTG
jgi:integrase